MWGKTPRRVVTVPDRQGVAAPLDLWMQLRDLRLRFEVARPMTGDPAVGFYPPQRASLSPGMSAARGDC